MKRVIIVIIMFTLLINILSGAIRSISLVQMNLDDLSDDIQAKDLKSIPFAKEKNIDDVSMNFEDSTSPGLRSGVYNTTELNSTVVEDILDTTKWYVGNTSLTSEYAFKVYNDTLQAVENATETSKSIIDRFFGIFKQVGDDQTDGLVDMFSKILGEAKNLTKSVREMIGDVQSSNSTE